MQSWLQHCLREPPPRALPIANDTASAVLVPVLQRPAGPTLLFVRKSARLKRHAGQVGFPGGRVEATDLTPEQAALREAHEEVGLPPDTVQLVGALDDERTYVTDFHIRPVVGYIAAPPAQFMVDLGELEATLEISLQELIDERPASWVEFTFMGQVWRAPRYEFSGGRVVWGATARILRGLQVRLRHNV